MVKNVHTLYCLVGEQPIPNLIPIKHINPAQVVLWHTSFTSKRCKYLEELLKAKNIYSTAKEISPYHLERVITEIERQIEKSNQVDSDNIMFNLTGGTKPMSIGSFLVCQKYDIPFCYLQSEGGKSLLYSYTWKGKTPVIKETLQILNIVDLDEYIKIHVGEYKRKHEHHYYEQLIINCIKDRVDEMISNIYLEEALEVDLIFRIGNQVGIAEIKTKNKATKKEGIDQLSTAGGREYLGTYTKKFLIVDRKYPENNKDLANVRNIKVIELENSPGDTEDARIDEKDKELLVQTILTEMTC